MLIGASVFMFFNLKLKAGHHASAPKAVERVLTRLFVCERRASAINLSGGEVPSGEWKTAARRFARTV
jgi:hypothetical protein